MISIVHKIVFVLCSAEALICMFLCLPLPAFATKLVVDMYRGGSSSTMTTVYYTLLAVVGILLLNAVYEVTTVQNVTVGLTDGSLCTDSLAVAYLCGFTLLLTRLSRRLFDLTAEHYVMVLNNKMVEEQKAKAAAQKAHPTHYPSIPRCCQRDSVQRFLCRLGPAGNGGQDAGGREDWRQGRRAGRGGSSEEEG